MLIAGVCQTLVTQARTVLCAPLKPHSDPLREAPKTPILQVWKLRIREVRSSTQLQLLEKVGDIRSQFLCHLLGEVLSSPPGWVLCDMAFLHPVFLHLSQM